MESEVTEYTVRVKDRQQDITHTVHEWAISQNEANTMALGELRDLLDHDELELV
jgi:hypothetical protein